MYCSNNVLLNRRCHTSQTLFDFFDFLFCFLFFFLFILIAFLKYF